MTTSTEYSPSCSTTNVEGRKFLVASMLAVSALTVPSSHSENISLIKNGLMQCSSASRPDRLPGELRSISKRSTARSLLKHAGTWVGDDLEKCLAEVYAVRGEAEF